MTLYSHCLVITITQVHLRISPPSGRGSLRYENTLFCEQRAAPPRSAVEVMRKKEINFYSCVFAARGLCQVCLENAHGVQFDISVVGVTLKAGVHRLMLHTNSKSVSQCYVGHGKQYFWNSTNHLFFFFLNQSVR